MKEIAEAAASAVDVRSGDSDSGRARLTGTLGHSAPW